MGGFEFGTQPQNSINLKQGKKFKELFCYLIFKNGEPVSRTELIDVLFDGIGEKKNINYLHVMIYNIRKIMTEYGIPHSLDYSGESYIFRVASGYCDITDLNYFIKENRVIDSSNLAQAASLATSCGGEFLENADYKWVSAARKCADKKIEQLLISLIKYYINSEQYYDSEKYLDILLKKKPGSRNTWNIILDMCVRRENKLSYIKQYERYRRILKTEFACEPEEVWTKYYHNYLRELRAH